MNKKVEFAWTIFKVARASASRITIKLRGVDVALQIEKLGSDELSYTTWKTSQCFVTPGNLITATSSSNGRRGFLVWIIFRTNSLGLSPEGSLNLFRVLDLMPSAIPKWDQFLMLRLSSSFMHILHKVSECCS